MNFKNKKLLQNRIENYLQNPQKQSKVKKYETKIDHLVYKLYNLTPEEIKIVESK